MWRGLSVAPELSAGWARREVAMPLIPGMSICQRTSHLLLSAACRASLNSQSGGQQQCHGLRRSSRYPRLPPFLSSSPPLSLSLQFAVSLKCTTSLHSITDSSSNQGFFDAMTSSLRQEHQSQAFHNYGENPDYWNLIQSTVIDFQRKGYAEW